MTDFDTSDLASLQEFINEYPSFSMDAPEPPTLMDIAGFSHRESVYSNILRFFLNAKEEFHDFETLFIRAILGAYRCRCREEWCKGAPDPEAVETTDSVEREVRTAKGKYIDILIECAEFQVCIENKIWSPLHNDLGEYREHCEENSRKDVLGIVLSPYRFEDKDSKEKLGTHHFVNITYGDLVEQVRQRMSSYNSPRDTRYKYLLLDFLEQATSFKQTMTTSERKFLQFWQENEEKINEIYSNCDKMRYKMRGKPLEHVKQVREKLTDEEKDVFNEGRRYNPRSESIYDASWVSYFDLADNVDIDGCKIFLDVAFYPVQVTYYLGARNEQGISQLSSLVKQISDNTGIAFDCYDCPSGQNKIPIKQVEGFPFEDSVCTDAVETSVVILRAIAAMCLADQEILQGTS